MNEKNTRISELMNRYGEFFRYFLTNGATTILYMILYYLGNRFLSIHYIVSNVLSYCISVGIAYILTRVFVFGSNEKAGTQIFYFIVTRILFVIASSGLIWLFVEAAGMNQYIAQSISTVMCFAGSYFVNRRIFKADRKSK